MRFRILKYLPPDRKPAAPAAPAARPHPGQRVLVRGRPRPPAADPALHVVRHAAPPAAAGLRACAARSSGTRWSRAAAAPCTPTSWCTTRRCPRSSTRCRSAWSSWRRGRGWWPTSAASSPRPSQIGMAVRAEFVDYDEELSLPVFVPAGAGGGEPDGLQPDRRAAGGVRGGDRALRRPGRRRAHRRRRGERRAHRPRPVAGAGRRRPARAWPCPRPTAAPATA